MYFGSVRFYKHLILIFITVLVIGSVAGCIYFSVHNSNMKKILAANGLSDDPNASGSMLVSDDPALIEREKMSQYYLTSYPYHDLYPQLNIDNDFIYADDISKSVYLTFDDGPSSLTTQILDILRQKGVQATFFVNYNDSVEAQVLYKRMLQEGHTIGVHSTCHQYATIYQSTQAYLDDFAQTASLLEQVTGVKPEIFRFPGGSINAYNRATYQQTIAEMVRRGYTYYDWNVSSDDATSTVSSQQIYNNVVSGVQRNDKSVVLMHDASDKFDTVSALSDIIDTLSAQGYTFHALNKDVKPVAFDYVD